MCHTHTTSDQDGKAAQVLTFKCSHKTYILCINVDAVIACKGDPNLEFARQVGRAINWLVFITLGYCHGFHLLAIDPDLVIRMSAWSKVHGNAMSNLLYLCLCAVSSGCRTGHHIAIHIATGC